jgi:hypothetical protein
MTVLVTAITTEFTPTKTTFAVNVSGGAAELLRKLESASIFQGVGVISNEGVQVDNVVGSVYKLETRFGNPTVRATE